MSPREPLDPNHGAVRRTATFGSIALMLFGAAVLVYGFGTFGSTFMTPTEKFFANPDAVMDQTRHDGFVGILAIAVGAFALLIGAKALFFARIGSLLRYTAAETNPVAKAAFVDLADGTKEGVETIAHAAAKGVAAGAGEPRAETVKVRCRGCGHLEREGARFCSGCGASL